MTLAELVAQWRRRAEVDPRLYPSSDYAKGASEALHSAADELEDWSKHNDLR